MFLRTNLRQLNWAYINHIANTKYYFSWSQTHLKAQALEKKKEKIGGKRLKYLAIGKYTVISQL